MRKALWTAGLARHRRPGEFHAVWNQPYLETCCRSAMHRLQLCGDAGRPAGMADDRCLIRLMEMGLCRRRPDGRFAITPEGALRHTEEIVGSSAKLPDSARR